MKYPVKLYDKTYIIEAYTTKQEKEILISNSFNIYDYSTIFEILNFKYDISDFNEETIKTLLYKYRSISIGDDITVKFKCSHCGQTNETSIIADNFYIEPSRNDKDVKKLNVIVTDDTLQQFVNIDVDELDIIEYEQLKQRVIDNQPKFNFIKSCSCFKCNTKKNFDMSSKEYIFDIMSEDSLMTLYKTYNYLIYFGNYSKLDIDSMYPFERTVFIGLLNKTKEDLNR